MLIPVFFVLVGWSAPAGRGGHSSSAWRYLIYNAAGGLALLLATAAYGVLTGTTNVLGHPGPLPNAPNAVALWWIFAGLAFAFLVKTPVWPLHTWMPDTYADLPAPMVAVVSAVQSKAGLYGFIALGSLMPGLLVRVAPLMFVLGAISLLHGALVALTQNDAKRVVAYSSLSHLGLILIAVFTFTATGVPNAVALGGAVVYMVAHGLFSAALFLVLGQVEQREETRMLNRLGGLGARNPRLAGALTIAALAALGLPGLAGFAGEILIITGVYQAGNVWLAALVLVPIIIASAYMLRLLQDAMNGPEHADLPQRPDLSLGEGLALAPLVIALVLLGVYPAPIANQFTGTSAMHQTAALGSAAASGAR
jgi:NADH-quinone oxidoreductase subunit M